MVKLVRAGRVHGCKRYTGAAAGDLVKTDAKVAAATDKPLGFLVDDIRTTNPPDMLDAHGDGAIIDLTGILTAGAVGATVYSDGDGTVSTTQPSGVCYIVGHIYGDEDGSTSCLLEVGIAKVIDQAA